MRRSLDAWEAPPTEAELERHYGKVVPLLAAALTVLRENNLVSKLEKLDEAATLTHYRQQRDDPQESQIAYAHAKQIIEADPADRQSLKELVRDAVEEPGLRKAWDWVFNLLYGLTGQQKLVWKSERDRAKPPSSPTSEAKGSPESGVRHPSDGRTLEESVRTNGSGRPRSIGAGRSQGLLCLFL